jgi:hypothetical protein
VEGFGKEATKSSLDMPRKVTVYGAKWPEDEDTDRALRYFRKYVKVGHAFCSHCNGRRGCRAGEGKRIGVGTGLRDRKGVKRSNWGQRGFGAS